MLPDGMPFRRERTAPALDLSDPLGILRYFSDLEFLFKKHRISDDQDKKEAAVYYPSVQVERAWRCDEAFEDPSASFSDFKGAIIALYPATTAALNPYFTDLERLVTERSHQPFHSKAELGEYYCNFRVISQSLIERGHISKGTQARLLFASFEASLATAIWTQLMGTFPDRLPDDLYQTKDIYAAALHVLAQCQFKSVFLEPKQEVLSLPTPVSAVSAVLASPRPSPRPLMPTVCTISHASVAETQATATPESSATEPIALLGDASPSITEVANTIPPRISHPLPDSNPVVAQENLCAVGTVSTISEDSDSVPRGPSAHSDSSSDIPRVSPISDRVPERTPQIATIVAKHCPRWTQTAIHRRRRVYQQSSSYLRPFPPPSDTRHSDNYDAKKPKSRHRATMLQWLYHPRRRPNRTASPLHATSSTLGFYKRTCTSLPLVTPSVHPGLRACISLCVAPTSQQQLAPSHFRAYRPSFDAAAPNRGVSTTMREMFAQCIRSPSDTMPATRGLRRFVRAFGMVLGVVKRRLRSREHVRDSGALHFRQYDLILHLQRHVLASDHATAVRTIALRWPMSNDIRLWQQHRQAPQQRARASRLAFFNSQPNKATPKVQPLSRLSHKRADLRIFQVYLPIMCKALYEFSGSADACTIALTRALSDLVTSHIGQRLCAIADEPLFRGSFYFVDKHQIALHVGIRTYKLRGDVHTHAIVISLITQSAPECGSIATEPYMRWVSRLSRVLKIIVYSTPDVFGARRRVRNGGKLHIQQSDPIPRRQRHIFNSKHATIVRRFALRWLRSGEVRCRRRRLQSPRQRAQALSLAFFNSQTEMAITRVQLLWRPSHVCAELRASQTRLKILFNASLAFLDTAVTCAIARTRKLCDLVLSHSGWNVCAIASKPPSRGNFNSGGRLQATLRIGGTAYRFRGHVLDIGGLHIYQLNLSSIGHRATALAVVQHSRRLLYFFRRQQIAIDVGTRAYGLRSDVQGQSIVISPVTQPAPEYGLISAAPRVRTPPRLSGVLKRSFYITLRVIKSRRHVRDGADLKIRRTDPLPRSRHVFATRNHVTFARTFALRLPTLKDISHRQHCLQVPRQCARALPLAFFDCQRDTVTSKVQPLLHASHVFAHLRTSHTCSPTHFKSLLAFSTRAGPCATAATHTSSDLPPAPLPIAHRMPLPEPMRDWGQYFFQWGGETGPCPSLRIGTVASVALGICILALQFFLSISACFANSRVLGNSHLRPFKPPTTIPQFILALRPWLVIFAQLASGLAFAEAKPEIFRLCKYIRRATVLVTAPAPHARTPSRLICVLARAILTILRVFKSRAYMHNGAALSLCKFDTFATSQSAKVLATATCFHTSPYLAGRHQAMLCLVISIYRPCKHMRHSFTRAHIGQEMDLEPKCSYEARGTSPRANTQMTEDSQDFSGEEIMRPALRWAIYLLILGFPAASRTSANCFGSFPMLQFAFSHPWLAFLHCLALLASLSCASAALSRASAALSRASAALSRASAALSRASAALSRASAALSRASASLSHASAAFRHSSLIVASAIQEQWLHSTGTSTKHVEPSRVRPTSIDTSRRCVASLSIGSGLAEAR
jgi:hypothetical protein